MAHRRLSDAEASLAQTMARARLEGGEAPESVAAGISAWLRAARGWNGKNAADRRAREAVERAQRAVDVFREARARAEERRAAQARLHRAAEELQRLGVQVKVSGYGAIVLDVEAAESLARRLTCVDCPRPVGSFCGACD